eukprot:CCRYP_001411-RE/>CCRYP_001411-RE protein AED:0.47 eAED:0.75 QI:0/0/0/1/0/0/2/0/149
MRKSLDEFFKPYFARHQFDGSGIMDTTICLPDIAIVTVVLGELAWKESFNEDSCIFFGFVVSVGVHVTKNKLKFRRTSNFHLKPIGTVSSKTNIFPWALASLVQILIEPKAFDGVAFSIDELLNWEYFSNDFTCSATIKAESGKINKTI